MLAVLQSLQPRDVKELRSANLIIHVRLHRPLLSGEHQNGDRACEKEDSRILAGAGQDSCLMHTNPFESNVPCFDSYEPEQPQANASRAAPRHTQCSASGRTISKVKPTRCIEELLGPLPWAGK